ncbi:tetratricopeptide repeat protein [Kurthia gibsonii]|uniref:tetratricopeptide repeat protein n=1 Tax=Kurthia gibsonii TaxID=33946 RepID=UPI003F230FC1
MDKKTYKKLLAKHKNPYDLIFLTKHQTSIESITDLYNSLKNIPNISRYLEGNLFPKRLEQLNSSTSKHFVNLEKELVWLTAILKSNSKIISSFNNYRTQYNDLLFNSDFEKAFEVLQKIENEVGLSMWLIENKIKLLQKIEGISKHKKYLYEIIGNDDVSEIVKIILHFKSMCFEEIFSSEKYEQELQTYIDKLFVDTPDAAGRSYLLDKLSLTIPNYEHEQFKIQMDKSLPLIDRYNELTKILFTLSEKKILSDHSLNLIVDNLSSINGDSYINFLSKKNSESLSDVDKKAIEILDLYSSGDYSNAIDLSISFISHYPTYIEIYDPFLKSCIYLDKQIEISKENLLGTILHTLHEVYEDKSNLSTKVQPLIKICYENNLEVWAWKLYSFITNLIEPANLNYNQVCRIGFKNFLLPKAQILKNIYSLEDALTILSILERNVPNSSTLKLQSVFLKSDVETLKSLNLPKDRELKYLGAIQYSSQKYYDAIESYEQLITITHPIHHFEIYCILTKCYLNVLDFDRLSKIVSNHYLKDISLVSKDDYTKLINLLDEQTYDKSIIDIPILYYYYSKNISNDKDYLLTDIYEDFLYAHDLSKPSELDIVNFGDSNLKIAFFLEKICSVDTISKSIEFRNISEVEEERIKICNILKQLNPSNKENYDSEIQEITSKMTLKQITRVIDSNKIYVDENGIKSNLQKKIGEDFSRFISFKSLDNEKLEQFIALKNFSNVRLFTNEKWATFVNLVKEIRNEFVYSKNFGLNGYLSVNIRHGTLIGHLRRELEKEHLITQIDSNSGIYIPNTYWLEKIVANEHHKNLIQDKLDIFSNSYDTKIAQLKDEYIQIKTESNRDSLGLFDFSLYSSILRSLFYEVLFIEDLSLNKFIDIIISHLWDITEKNLIRIKKFLNSEFRSHINSYFEELLYNLSSLPKFNNLVELTNKIIEVKTQTNREIDILISWFTKNKDNEVDNFKLAVPIEIAYKSSKNMNINITSQIDINDIEGSTIKFQGKYLNPLVSLFTNLFDNAMKRSGFEFLEIYVEFKIIDFELNIKVTNKVNLDKISLEERIKKIEESKVKLNLDNKTIDFISTEGGSGLPKLLKLIKVDLACDGNLDFNIYDDIFQVDLKIDIQRLLV